MDCRDAVPNELVESYVQGRLDESAREGFEDHYFGCPACLARLETTPSSSSASRSKQRPTASRSRGTRTPVVGATRATFMSWTSSKTRAQGAL